jgi:hypothetical protein
MKHPQLRRKSRTETKEETKTGMEVGVPSSETSSSFQEVKVHPKGRSRYRAYVGYTNRLTGRKSTKEVVTTKGVYNTHRHDCQRKALSHIRFVVDKALLVRELHDLREYITLSE